MTTPRLPHGHTARSLLGTADSPELVLRRAVRASSQAVLAACTDPRRLAQWLGPVEGEPGGVGDAFTLRDLAAEQTATGEVLACAEEGLSVSWSWQGEPESVLSVRVTDTGEGECELTLLLVLAAPEQVPGSGSAWEQRLGSLARHLEEEGAATGEAEAGAAPGEGSAAVWEAMTARPLEIRWHLPADVETVWTALATTSGLRPWWWAHVPVVTLEADAAPGATYRITAPSAGIELEGTYLIVDRPRQLSATWHRSEAGLTSQDEAVEIALAPAEGGTVITLRHTGPWTDERAPENHRQGWQDTLAALERSLLP